MGIPIIGGNGPGKLALPPGLTGAKFKLPGTLARIMQKKQVGMLLLPPLRTAAAGPPTSAFLSASAAKLLLVAARDAPAMITRVARAIYSRLPDFDRGIPTPYDDLYQEYREKMEDRAALAIMGEAPTPSTTEDTEDTEEKP